MFEWHGYGRAYPPGRRQIVGAVFHLSDHERYRRLNDVVCVCVGEVRRPDGSGRNTGRSGPVSRAGRTGKGNPYLKGALGEAAASAVRTDPTRVTPAAPAKGRYASRAAAW